MHSYKFSSLAEGVFPEPTDTGVDRPKYSGDPIDCPYGNKTRVEPRETSSFSKKEMGALGVTSKRRLLP